MSYQSSRESEIRKKSEDALAGLPEAAKPAAEASRAMLFNWLVKMDADMRSAKSVATDDLADFAIAQFQEVLGKLKGDGSATKSVSRLKKLEEAIAGLTDDEALNSFRYMLGQVLVKLAGTTKLFSQNLSDGRWEETGFFADDGVGVVAAAIAGGVVESTGAVSRTPYQPIGYLNDKYYVPTEASKLLWSRPFALALLVPYQGAFKVEQREAIAADAPFTDIQLRRAEELIQTLEQDLVDYDALAADDIKGRATKSEAVVVAIEIGSLGFKPLEDLLTRIREEHPEVGDRFQNANVRDLALSIGQFLRERVAAELAYRRQATTELIVEAPDPLALPKQMLANVSNLLSVEGAPEHNATWAAISHFKAAYPGHKEEVDLVAEEGGDTRQQLERIKDLLDKELAK